MSKKRTIALAVGVIILIILAVIAGRALFGSSRPTITHADLTTVERSELTREIPATGTLAPKSQTTLSTTLTGPIQDIYVRPGDRVGQGQLLARIDASDVQAQLNKQRAEQSINESTNAKAVEKAQQEAQQQAELINRGLNPEINSAETALAEAQGRVNEAVANGDPSEIDAAVRARDEAQTALDAAKVSATHQLYNSQAAVSEAQEAANATAASNELANNELIEQINSSEVYSPHEGVITAVPGQEGKPGAEGLVSIGDDSVLLIRSMISESEIASVKEGMKVRFTTVPTKEKVFTGRITFVSPVAMEQPADKEQGSSSSSGSGFPIEIEVGGDKEGLRIGTKAKAKIIIEASPPSLIVPIEAVADDDVVLVLDTSNGGSTVVEKKVTRGMNNDFFVAVTSKELEAGDQVISRAAVFRHLVGQEVRPE